MYIKNGYILVLLVLLFNFFPYLTLMPFGTDIQPFGLVFSLLLSALVLLTKPSVKSSYFLLLIPFLFGLLMVFFSTDLFSGVRSLVGLANMAFTPIAFVYILNNHYKLFTQFIKFTTIVYGVVGIIQLVFIREFMHSLLYRLSTTSNRGVTSLTAEPTSFGTFCIFLILIFLVLEINNKWKYIFILLLEMILLSQSSMAMLFVLIFITYYFVFKINYKILLGLFFLLVAGIFVFKNLNFASSPYRVVQIVNNMINQPKNIFFIDGSFNDRLSHIHFALKGFFENWLLPNGYGTFKDYLLEVAPKQEFFWNVWYSNKVMSYYGGIFFELGFIALLIPIAYTKIIYNAYRPKIRDFLVVAVFINTILFTAIPQALPFVGMLIAVFTYKSELNKTVID